MFWDDLIDENEALKAQLAAAEKRATEAEAFIALTSDLTEDFHTPPAAAQAVAEFIKDVLVAYDTWLGAVDFAEAVCDARRKYLAALDKEPTT